MGSITRRHNISRAALPNEAAADVPVARMRDTIVYEDAVAEARKILEQFDLGQMRIGALADQVAIKYGERTLKNFARDIGIAVCTVGRYRDVFRAWKEIHAPGRELIRYSVARELAAHPDRAEIVKDNPTITKREAGKLMRRFRNGKTAPKSNAGTVRALAEYNENDDQDVSGFTWLGRVIVAANKTIGLAADGHDANFELDDALMETIREASRAWAQIVDECEQRTCPISSHRAVADKARAGDG